jgi:hypothetical protein
VLFGVVPASGGLLLGVLGDDGFVELGVVFGTVLGVADGGLGAALGVLGAVLGVTSGVAPGSVCMVVELGLVEAGGFVALGVVLGDCCGLIVLCELGLLEWAVPLAAPVLDPVLDCA